MIRVASCFEDVEIFKSAKSFPMTRVVLKL